MAVRGTAGLKETTDHPFDIQSFFLGPSTLDTDTDDKPIGHTEYRSQARQSVAHTSTSSDSTSSKSKSGPNTRTSITSSHTATKLPVSYETVLVPETPYNRLYLALGTIKLFSTPESGWLMHGRLQNERYPHSLLDFAQNRGWISIDDLSINDLHDDGSLMPPRLRVYIMPEDVERGSRGPMKEFRKVVQFLMKFVDRSQVAWTGAYKDIEMVKPFEAPLTDNEESLFYIFNTLRSPSPHLSAVQNSSDGYQAVSEILNHKVIGLKTQLYSYQMRSVAAMVQRESEPANIIDPRKTLFKDMFGNPFYLDSYDGTLLKTPALYPEPQGGILAETMGYGKTLICISLILATRGHYPRVPGDRVDIVPVEPRPKVASLLSMAARKIKHDGVPWKVDFGELKKKGYHYDRCLDELAKYDRAYDEPTFNPTTPTRRCKPESANLIRLCSATLVVVPPNLLLQWQHEIRKHTEEDALDLLVVDSSTKEIPSWKKLLDYDMILITKSKFEQEFQDDDLHQGKRKRGAAKYQSPLTQVRWLRVICDEGHGFAGSSSHTKAMAMLDNMYIERRWVVSGTPSSTLHGVEVDLSAVSPTSLNGFSASMPESPTTPGRCDSISTRLEKRKAPNSQDQETRDLDRLRIMVVKFLHLQPWANQRGKDNANWKRYLAPVVDEFGSRKTPLALRDVLQTLIIRHRIEDIDTDLTLPPLYNRVMYLTPSYHDKVAINMFMLVLTSNYITSEREDEDYMFHPKNRKKFDQLVNNLRQATFHWVGFSEHDVKETLRVSKEYLNKNLDKISGQDHILLNDAIKNAERALADPSWLAFSKLHEIGCFITLFPETASEAWALDGRVHDDLLLGTVQAREVQKFYRSQVLKEEDDPLSNLIGKGMKVMNAARTAANEEENQKPRPQSLTGEKQQIGTTDEPRLRVASAPRPLITNVTPSKKKSSPRKRPRILPNMGSDVTIVSAQSESFMQAPVAKVVPPTAISGFSSSKLTYLMDQLLHHSSTSKSIVFYSSNNTAFWTAEALELLRIPFLIYANTLSVAQRNNYLSIFNTDNNIRVLLMDLKQASHGLHIASANRVYIIAPIWDKGVESQAIKRAHRIGQARDVYVETLVLRGTFEEEMVKRRQNIDQYGKSDSGVYDNVANLMRTPNGKEKDEVGDGSQPLTSPSKSQATARQKIQSLLDDHHMVQVLKNLSFLTFTPDEEEHPTARVARLNAPEGRRLLFAAPPDTGKDDPHTKVMTSPDGTKSDGMEDTIDARPSKKARTVGFVVA